MNQKDILEIEQTIGYTFENKNLLRQAFVRRSYTHLYGGENNDVLEFIGDTVLAYLSVKELTARYGEVTEHAFVSDYTEDKLSRMKQILVQGTTLSAQIERTGFANHLVMSPGDVKHRVDKKSSVKEALFESLIGAVTVDCNWDIAKIETVLARLHDFNFHLAKWHAMQKQNRKQKKKNR